MEVFLVVWFSVAFLSAVWVAYDEITTQPEIMGVMKVAWVLITLYFGVVGVILYLTSCREPQPGTHDQWVSPLWKQAVGSTMHCVAGDAVGIVLAAAVTAAAGLSGVVEFPIEYVAGFLFGWLVFQTLPQLAMGKGKGLVKALKEAFTAEFISLTAMVAGMFPAMYWMMGMGGSGHHELGPEKIEFWGVMAAAIAIGFVFTYPVNWMLVVSGRKHGMGSMKVMGVGGNETREDSHT